MDERIDVCTMTALATCTFYHVARGVAVPNRRYLHDAPIYDWDERLGMWCKRPRTGGKMLPIVEAAEREAQHVS